VPTAGSLKAVEQVEGNQGLLQGGKPRGCRRVLYEAVSEEDDDSRSVERAIGRGEAQKLGDGSTLLGKVLACSHGVRATQLDGLGGRGGDGHVEVRVRKA
jgi:hypothetical protein